VAECRHHASAGGCRLHSSLPRRGSYGSVRSRAPLPAPRSASSSPSPVPARPTPRSMARCDDALRRSVRGADQSRGTSGHPPSLGIMDSTSSGRTNQTLRLESVYVRDPHQAPASTPGRTMAAKARPRRDVLGAEQTAQRRPGESVLSLGASRWHIWPAMTCFGPCRTRTPESAGPLYAAQADCRMGLTGQALLVGGCRESAVWACPCRGPVLDQRLPTFRRGAH
jgi:hypothetical protein